MEYYRNHPDTPYAILFVFTVNPLIYTLSAVGYIKYYHYKALREKEEDEESSIEVAGSEYGLESVWDGTQTMHLRVPEMAHTQTVANFLWSSKIYPEYCDLYF